MLPRTAVYITWEELFDVRPKEEEILETVRQFNRQSAAILLARLEARLFLDLAIRNESETIRLQSFLVANFWDDELLTRAKERMGTSRLDYRIAFHSQQILTLMRSVVLHSLPTGGTEPDIDKDARFALGRALLKTSSLLMSGEMKAKIAQDRRKPSARNYLRLQLSLGAGNEVTNPPPVMNGVARSAVIFEEILTRTPTPIDLSKALEGRTGLSLNTYVDLTLGLLSAYLGRKPSELVENAGISILGPDYFGPSVSSETAHKFWEMESTTFDELRTRLSMESELIPCQDFTAFRMRPFVRLDNGKLFCINPGFVQEKLEVGLFWTITNNLQGADRKSAFDAWGKLFEAYINETLQTAVDPAREEYFPRPDFIGKKHHHESFDGILVAGRVCAVFECKGGFLPNDAKYAEDLDEFVKALERKFGTDQRAGVEQLVRKINQVFSRDMKVRRELEGVDVSAVEIVVPVLVVQDNFASSLFTLPWLARSFRDLMRKTAALDERIVWPSLVVLHVEDVERLSSYVKAGAFTLSECLLDFSAKGDPAPGRLFSFDLLFPEYLREKGIEKVPPTELDRTLRKVLERVSMRFFGRHLEPSLTP